jgi:hypothetical protein
LGVRRDSNPQSPEPQSGALPFSYEHHLVPTSGNDPLWKYLWDIFDHLIKSVIILHTHHVKAGYVRRYLRSTFVLEFEESIVFETNPFLRAIDLAGHPNTLLVYFPFL